MTPSLRAGVVTPLAVAGDPQRLVGRMEQLPEALCSRGYTLDRASFPTRRPDRATLAAVARDGTPVVAKFYPSPGGENTFANMRMLWQSSFGERRRPPGLPRPIDYLADAGVLIMERVPGRPLVELEPVDPKVLRDSMNLVAALHACDAEPNVGRDARRIVRSVHRKVAEIRSLAPEHAGSVSAVVDALEASAPKGAELVPTHGDFSARNVLVASDRLVLIDWDRFRRADPARDVAYMGTWHWVWSLRRGQQADWSVLAKTVAWYQTLRPTAAVESRIPFYVAAGLVRVAHSLVKLWPAEAHLVPRIADEALRQLR